MLGKARALDYTWVSTGTAIYKAAIFKAAIPSSHHSLCLACLLGLAAPFKPLLLVEPETRFPLACAGRVTVQTRQIDVDVAEDVVYSPPILAILSYSLSRLRASPAVFTIFHRLSAYCP